MQALLAELLWRNDEIDQAAHQLCQTIPGFSDIEQTYEALAEQVRSAAGNDLYDQFYTQLIRYTDHEVQAYYSLGLGLREELLKTLEL